MALPRAVEVERLDAMDVMELVAPLHRPGAQVPQPAPHVRQRLAVADTRLDLGEAGLRQALLGDVAADQHGRDRVVTAVEHRAQRQRDRHGHAVTALDLRLEVAHRVAGHHRVDRGLHVVPDMGSEQLGAASTEDLLGREPEEPLGRLVPAGDAGARVEAQDGVIRRPEDGLEDPLGGRRPGGREPARGARRRHHDMLPDDRPACRWLTQARRRGATTRTSQRRPRRCARSGG